MKQPTIDSVGVEEMMEIYSSKYNVDLDVAKHIISCESKFDPKAEQSNKRHGTTWSKDVGYWQINDYYHKKDLQELGWDIYNPDDNLEAGFYIMSKEGTKPWLWSSNCWKQT